MFGSTRTNIQKGYKIMGICKAGLYKDDIIIKHSPIICYGGLGEESCKYLNDCMEENHIKLKNHRNRRQNNGKNTD